ncbi:MAG: NADH-quinone oxidoreductase subunit D [Candidatus Parvarchaeota archaeon]|nr:NADH-quinone oxidoreductase subunit D [Candidatus Parvarchaeota archaeon]
MEKQKGVILNIGPVHPATHGVLKLIADLEGDTIDNIKVEIGFLHRGKEKMAEMRYFSNYYPIVDKLDYVSALQMEILFASVVEKAAGIEIPPRAVYIRTIMAEIQRIMSHLVFVGSFGMDVGNYTGFIWAFREREELMTVVEAISGGRLAPMYICNGGTFYDLPENFSYMLSPVLDRIEKKVKNEYATLFQKNNVFIMRSKSVGIIDKQLVKQLGITGPNMRAAGIERDIRRVDPYLAYEEMEFEVPTEEDGDAYSRFLIRIREIIESIKIIRQAMKKLPAGSYKKPVPWLLKIPAKYTLVRHEVSKGEMAMHMVTDGGMMPYRLKIRSPTFFSLKALEKVLVGSRIADIVAVIASIDPVMGEVDR